MVKFTATNMREMEPAGSIANVWISGFQPGAVFWGDGEGAELFLAISTPNLEAGRGTFPN